MTLEALTRRWPEELRIKHDAPKHKCPICNHTCHPSKRLEARAKVGRPPVQIQRLVQYLTEHATAERPVSGPELGRLLGKSVATTQYYVYRARMAGHPIKTSSGRGYYLDANSPNGQPLKKNARA